MFMGISNAYKQMHSSSSYATVQLSLETIDYQKLPLFSKHQNSVRALAKGIVCDKSLNDILVMHRPTQAYHLLQASIEHSDQIFNPPIA
jgi:hypothetical protein